MKALLRLACYVLILSSRFIWGADFQVTNNVDSGPGSFRQSIIDLNASRSQEPNTVTFDPGLGRIQLFSDLPAIEVEGEFITSTGDSLVIDGSGNQNRIFSTSNKPFKVNASPSSCLALLGTLDSGSLIKLGNGELLLEENNSYTGGTEIVGGLLALSGSGSLALTGKVVIDSEGAFDISAISSDSQTISDLSGSRGKIVLGAKTLIIEEGLSTEYGGVISGTGAIVKQGLGTLTLTESNTYTGRTTINTGTLALSGTGGLAPTSKVITHSGAVFDMSSITASSQTIGNLSGSGGEIELGEKTLIIGGMLSTVYGGVISGTGSIIKKGPQMLILMGENTYTGGTIVNGGTLQGNTTSLQGDIVNHSSLVFDQISLGEYAGVISGSGALTKQNTGLLILSNTNTYTGGTTISGGILQGNTTSLQGDIINHSSLVFDQISLGEYAGVISGSGTLIKKNAGTLILSNTNTYSGGTTVIEGALQGNTKSLQGDIANDALVIFDQVDAGTFNGMITGTGVVIKQNTGTLILKGSNHTGGTTIKGGKLALLARLPSIGSIEVDAGTFDISSLSASLQTIYNLSGIGGEVVLGTSALIAGSFDDTIYEGVISGDGSFIKQGSGTLTFGGIHTYTGATTISSGRIALSGNGSLAIDNPVILSGADSIFDVTEANGARSIGSIDGVEGSQVLLGANALTVGDSNYTSYAGIISGTGAFIKQGSGKLILTGSNTYSGGTTVNEGVLQGNTNSLQGNILNSASVVFDQAYTGTYDGVLLGTGAIDKRNTGKVVFTGSNTYSGGTMITLGTLALSGSGTILSTGTVIINVGNFDISDITASSQTIGDLIGGGTIFLGEKILITATGNDTSYVGIINGAGSFVKQGSGTLTLSGANTYSGGTTIHDGTLALSGPGKLFPTGAVTIDAGAFDISNTTGSFQTIGDLSGSGGEVILGEKTLITATENDRSYAGVIRGSGALIKQGLGTLVLTGDNTYSGGTTVNDGVLRGNTNSLQGDIVNNASVAFDQAYTGTYDGILLGTGAVDKQNTGTVVFTGASTHSGGTTISAGTLALSGSGRLASTGAVTIDAGAFDISNITGSFQTIGDLSGSGGEVILGEKTLITATENDRSYAGVIRGSGALIKQGLGTLVLTGDNTYSGGTMVNDGVLQGNTNSLQGNIFNDAQLVFDQISSGAYEGIIMGNGSLIKQGSGMVTILNDCSCFTGIVSINEGALMMKGKMGGELEISANAMLAGVGSVENLINHGTVKPGSSIGTLTVNGNYTQGASGILNIEIDELEASSLLQLTGVATLNGVLQVNPEPGVYLEGTTYTFLTAGSVIGQFSSTFSTRPLNYVIDYFPTQAQLLILSSSLILPARPNGNAGAVVDYLFCSSFDFVNADLVVVAEALLELSADQYARALNRLTPSQFGAFALNELENNFSIANTFLNQKASCYATCESTNIWINPLGLVYSQKNRLRLGKEAVGFTNHTYGVTAGIDHLFSNDWKLGFGIGYSYSHLHWKNQAGKARADSGYLGPCIGYYNESFYFDFLVLGAGNFYDVDRKIAFPGIARVASSHPTTLDLSEMVLVGFKLEPFYRFFVQPEFLIDQLNVFQENFQESGAGSIDLDVKRKHVSFLRSLINVKFIKEWVCCNVCLAPSVNMGWLRTTSLTGRHYTARFRKGTFCAPNFSVTSFSEVVDQVLVSGQLLISSQGGFSISLGYDGRFGGGSKVNEINLALDWSF